jgi:hypothetical protein
VNQRPTWISLTVAIAPLVGVLLSAYSGAYAWAVWRCDPDHRIADDPTSPGVDLLYAEDKVIEAYPRFETLVEEWLFLSVSELHRRIHPSSLDFLLRQHD